MFCEHYKEEYATYKFCPECGLKFSNNKTNTKSNTKSNRKQKKDNDVKIYHKTEYEDYPVVTEENFEEVIFNILIDEGRNKKLKIKPPSDLEEFKRATKNLYGVELTATFNLYDHPMGPQNKKYTCQYEIVEKESQYNRGKIYKLWEKKLSSYQGLKALLTTTFGETYCGGVASSHYAQAYCSQEDFERLQNWKS